MRDHEVVGGILAKHERGPFAADELRGHTEDRVEQILCTTFAKVFHQFPHSRVAAHQGRLPSLPAFLSLRPSGSLRPN